MTGGARLAGEVEVVGAKNSVLKLMAAALLAPGETTIGNLPAISDVTIMRQLLEQLGCTVRESKSGGSDRVRIEVPAEPLWKAPYELVRRIRAASACSARCSLAPAGRWWRCPAGTRSAPGRWTCTSPAWSGWARRSPSSTVTSWPRPRELRGTTIWLDFPSVGATENLLTAAVLAKGTTVIDNAAREPEIVDLCQLLVTMGAQIEGIGSSTLEITGVDGLRPATHDAVADRIVAGTWAMAAVATRGDVLVRGAHAAHLEIALDKLVRAGADVEVRADGFRVAIADRPRSFDVVTLPYPGLATDLQPQAIALLAIADGTALITENLFEARFMFCDEIARMGADVRTDGHHAVVRGRERLSGAPVRATDIRAGVGLVIAGLVADGVTEIAEVHHIDRGYVRFEEQLRALGADVERAESTAFGS